VFTKPTGPVLNEEQAQALDDDFFGSRPMEYFHARIAGLLAAMPGADTEPSSVQQAFDNALAPLEGMLTHTERDREVQVAIDALSVRHHAAEALARLYHALTAPPAEGPHCVWAGMVDGPRSTAALVEASRRHLTSSAGADMFATLMLPPRVRSDQLAPAEAALNVAGAWLHRAMDLLVSGELDINAANNKVKHGLVVRARDDQRVAFIRTPLSAEGTVPQSAFTAQGSIDVFTRTTLRFLSRPPVPKGRKAHLESTTFQLVPETLLAEATMLSTTFGALFHRAGLEHLERHPVPAEGDPPQSGRHAPDMGAPPAMPLGPTPTQLLGNAVVGLRHPVTTAPDGGPTRGAAWVFEEQVVTLEVDVDGRREGTIVDG
jgi:hypothetical protein